MQFATFIVLSALFAIFCFEAEALRADTQARMDCTRNECAGARNQWRQSQKADDFKAYFACLDECTAAKLESPNEEAEEQ
uniref:Uncharacterized protein n=1 Tax=Trichuris muris TaxID=70415 RepID=A0A5S6QCR8_TRIMR